MVRRVPTTLLPFIKTVHFSIAKDNSMIRSSVRGLIGFALLSCIYLVSVVLVHYFSIPLPPALIGIFILLVLLLGHRSVPTFVTISARPMLAHMGLFLLPALISVLLYADLFAQYYMALSVAIVFSTILSLGITLWLSQRILSNVKAASIGGSSQTRAPTENDD